MSVETVRAAHAGLRGPGRRRRWAGVTRGRGRVAVTPVDATASVLGVADFPARTAVAERYADTATGGARPEAAPATVALPPAKAVPPPPVAVSEDRIGVIVSAPGPTPPRPPPAPPGGETFSPASSRPPYAPTSAAPSA